MVGRKNILYSLSPLAIKTVVLSALDASKNVKEKMQIN
jgi:hypothetical protein